MKTLIVNALYLEAVIAAALFVFFSALRESEKRQLQKSIAIVALLTPVFAFFSPNLIVFNLYCVAVVALTARDRSQIVPLFLFMIVTTPRITSEIQAGGLFLIRYSTVHSIAIGSLVTLFVKEGWNGRRLSAADLPCFALLTLVWLGNARGTALSNYGREAVQMTLGYLIPYLVVSRGMKRTLDIKLALVALASAAITLSMICTFETAKTWPIYRAIWEHYNIVLESGASVKLRGGLIRAPGPYPEPLSLSFVLTICILAFLSIRSSIRSRSIFLGLCAICGLGILAPQARGAWIALIVAVVSVDVYLARWKTVSSRVGLMIVAVVALLGAASVSYKVATLAGFTDEGRGTIDYRKTLLTRGIEEVRKKPLLGDSPSNVIAKMSDLMQGEGIVDFVNGYLYTALVSGLIGLSVLVVALFGQLGLIWSVRAKGIRNPVVSLQLAFAFSSLVAMIMMLGNISVAGPPLLMFGLVAGIAGASKSALLRESRLQRRQTREGDATSAAASILHA